MFDEESPTTRFSPRVLVAFVEDRASQTTLSVFVGTFTYCLLTLPAIRSRPRPFVPSVAVVVAVALAVKMRLEAFERPSRRA